MWQKTVSFKETINRVLTKINDLIGVTTCTQPNYSAANALRRLGLS